MGGQYDGEEGSFLAQPGEVETCEERNFLKSFSSRKFPVETCAERSFSKCVSSRNGGRISHFAQVSAGNVCELALRAPPRGHFAQVSAGNVCELALRARHTRKEAFL